MAIQERTVRITKDSGWDDYMAEHHGQTAFQNAIGYLAEWNMWADRFTTVRITCTLGNALRQPEIGASYYTKDGQHGYFICAIFQPQVSPQSAYCEDTDDWTHTKGSLATFSFHS